LRRNRRALLRRGRQLGAHLQSMACVPKGNGKLLVVCRLRWSRTGLLSWRSLQDGHVPKRQLPGRLDRGCRSPQKNFTHSGRVVGVRPRWRV
jgi:hypothetical protein